MAENTKFLNLKKPTPEEFYNIEDFNENFQKIDDFANGIKLTKEQVGLGNVDNTSDADKPVSTAQAEAIETARAEVQTNLNNHTWNTANPHGVTASQIGLGDVPNVKTNDQTPTYTEATTLTNLTSGEKISVAFGKIKKAITDLISHLADTTKHNKSARGGAIGLNATTSEGGAVGYSASATLTGGAIGHSASATTGGAVGSSAKTSNGAAIGNSAQTVDASGNAIDAVQLGSGRNPNPRTLQIYNYQLMDANGFIPAERLPITYKKIIVGTYTGTGTYVSGQETPTNIKAGQSTIQFPSYPRYVLIKRRTEDFWTAIAPNPEDNSIGFMSYGGNNYSGGLCSGEITSDYKMNWYANAQKWYYKANTSTGVVSIQLESIASGDVASLKPINQLNWQGETYDYIAFCD